MANEIKIEAGYGYSGDTFYAIVRNAAGEVWSPGDVAFITYDSSAFDSQSLAIIIPEYGSTAFFGPIDLPGTGAGRWWQIYRQVDVTPNYAVDELWATGFNDTGDILDTAPLTAQQTRDAMQLAPSAGAPAANSVEKKLDTIITKQH